MNAPATGAPLGTLSDGQIQWLKLDFVFDDMIARTAVAANGIRSGSGEGLRRRGNRRRTSAAALSLLLSGDGTRGSLQLN
jgi:hypothetical protein